MISFVKLSVIMLFFTFPIILTANSDHEVSKNYLEIVDKIEAAQDTLYSDSYLASKLLKTCIELSRKSDEDSLYYFSRYLYAISFSVRDKLDSAILISENLLNELPENKFLETQAGTYNHLASLYGKHNDLHKSMKYLLIADSLAALTNSKDLKLGIRNNIANVYMQNNDFNNALSFYKSALNVIKPEQINSSSKWSLTNNIILSFAHLYELDSARSYFYQLLQMENSPQIDKSESILNYAYAFAQTEQLDSALYFISMAYDSLVITNKSTRVLIDLSKASILLQKTMDSRFVDTLIVKINDPDLVEVPQVTRTIYSKIYSYFEKRKNFKEAFFYYQKYTELNDSLLVKSNSEKIKVIESKLKYQKLQNQFDLQNEHMSKQDARELLLYVIVISLTIFIIIVVYISIYRKRMISVLAEQKKHISEQYDIVEEKNKQLESQNQEIESMLEDLTKSKNYLEKLNKQKATFLSVLTHQLTNQVQAVMMSAEALFISRDEANQKFIRKFSEIIYSSSSHLGDMLANLKEWSNTQNNNIQIHKEQLDVRSILDMILFNMKPDLERKDIKIIIGFDSFEVFSDRETLTSVFKKLISNAYKYSSNLGEIRIDCTANESYSECRVQDFGTGISSENQSKLFNIETRFSTKGTKGEIGTGLGLLICKERVELVNGTIEIISKEKEGTTAVIKFPLEETSTNLI